MKNLGKSSRRRSQGIPKIFRAPIHGANCAVIFAIAQLSCYTLHDEISGAVTGDAWPAHTTPSAMVGRVIGSDSKFLMGGVRLAMLFNQCLY